MPHKVKEVVSDSRQSFTLRFSCERIATLTLGKRVESSYPLPEKRGGYVHYPVRQLCHSPTFGRLLAPHDYQQVGFSSKLGGDTEVSNDGSILRHTRGLKSFESQDSFVPSERLFTELTNDALSFREKERQV